MKQIKLMESLEETERKRERKLKAKGLIEKTLEDEMNERRSTKKLIFFDKAGSNKSLNFTDNFMTAHENTESEMKAPYKLPRLYSN